MTSVRDPFRAEIDASGTVVDCDGAAPADVPRALASVAAQLGSHGIAEARFIYREDGAPAWSAVVHAPNDAHPDRTRLTAEPCDELPCALTWRELDVLTLLVSGRSNPQIADVLGLSPRTVTTHVDRLLGKLGAASRTAAAVGALDEGLVRLPLPGGADGFALLRLGRALLSPADVIAPATRVPRSPLVIGAALPLLGFAAADGLEMVQASQLAVEEINARGGIGGRRVALDVVDVDILDAGSIANGLDALLARGADVVTSGYFAHQELAHDIMAEAGIPYLHAATMHAMEQRVRDDPGRYDRVFQMSPSDVHYAPRFVEVMTHLRDTGRWVPSSRTLAIVRAAWKLTDLGVAEATIAAERAGWSVDVIDVDADSADVWPSVARRLRHTEPAAAMIGHYLLEGTVALADRFFDDPCDTLLYSVYAPSIPEFRERLGARADGLLWATVTGTYSDPLARRFAGEYRSRFGRSPGRSHAGIAYDRVQLIASAWSSAADPRDARDVSRQLRRVIHRGVNGVYYLGEQSQTALTFPGGTGDPSLAQAHLVFQIQHGQQRIIDPTPYADAQFLAPAWARATRRLVA